MSISIHQHNEDFSTSGQIFPEDIVAIAQAGYKTIINNRPDGEGGPEQPLSSALEASTQSIGLDYHYLPVISGQYSSEQIVQMAKILETAKKPIFCFCRSGARSTQLYQLAIQN